MFVSDFNIYTSLKLDFSAISKYVMNVVFMLKGLTNFNINKGDSTPEYMQVWKWKTITLTTNSGNQPFPRSLASYKKTYFLK